MRRRITRAFLASAAAGATITTLGFAAVGSAGASVHGGRTFAPSAPTVATNTNCATTTTVLANTPLGLPSDGCAMAGYVASNRDFRYAQALITIPGLGTGTTADSPQMYVALDASTSNNYSFVRAGISRCTTALLQTSAAEPICPGATPAGSWVAYTQSFRNGTAMGTNVASLSGAVPGDGVLASVYREPSGNVVHVVLTVPTAGGSHTFQYDWSFPGATFTQAQARADWTLPHELATGIIAGGLPVLNASMVKSRMTQFFQGAFTTQSGIRGTFKNSAWTLTAPEATTNGNLPPAGTLVAEPGYLWNDGMGNGWGDAFGVWIGPF